MSQPTARPCPVCGARDARRLHTQRFALPEDSPLPDEQSIVACGECGAAYADAASSDADYERYYALHAKYADDIVGTGGAQIEADRLRIDALADELAQFVPVEARVIDIGCAGGGLLHALRERGFAQVAGIDPAGQCIERLQRDGFPAWTCALSSLASSAGEFGRYDLIVLSHVLEHVYDVAAALAGVAALAATGASVYIEVPDAARYGTPGFPPFYFFDSEHINHFDRTALENLARGLGWRIEGGGTKDLLLVSGQRYPAVWLLATIGAATPQGPREPGARAALAGMLEAYVAESAARADANRFDQLIDARTPVILWGAGSFAQRLFASTRLADCNIVGVVDNDRAKQGKRLCGHVVEPPSAARARMRRSSSVPRFNPMRSSRRSAPRASTRR